MDKKKYCKQCNKRLVDSKEKVRGICYDCFTNYLDNFCPLISKSVCDKFISCHDCFDSSKKFLRDNMKF